jgi:ribosomal protein S26
MSHQNLKYCICCGVHIKTIKIKEGSGKLCDYCLRIETITSQIICE